MLVSTLLHFVNRCCPYPCIPYMLELKPLLWLPVCNLKRIYVTIIVALRF